MLVRALVDSGAVSVEDGWMDHNTGLIGHD